MYNTSISQVIHEQLTDIDLEECEAQGENAFFVCDLASVWRAHQRWLGMFLPSGCDSTPVESFYGRLSFGIPFSTVLTSLSAAVKCNPDPTVISLLANLGLGFDCASQAEIELVLSLGISPERIIYANPCKAASFVRHAASVGVQMMTFDNADELTKVAKYHPSAKLVLRILTDDEGSLCRFGTKFGAALSKVRGLLQAARAHKLSVIGVSFHVGSGCTNPQLYESAIASAKWVFGVAREEGYDMNLLDIGGGFEGATFDQVGHVARASVDRHFPKSSGVRCIAEPGRFYVTEAFELATNIIARRGLSREDEVDFQGAKVVEDEAPVVMCEQCILIHSVFISRHSTQQIISTMVSMAPSIASCSTIKRFTPSSSRSTVSGSATRLTYPLNLAPSGVPPATPSTKCAKAPCCPPSTCVLVIGCAGPTWGPTPFVLPASSTVSTKLSCTTPSTTAVAPTSSALSPNSLVLLGEAPQTNILKKVPYSLRHSVYKAFQSQL